MESESPFQVGDLVVYVGRPEFNIGYGYPDTPLGINCITSIKYDSDGWGARVNGHSYWASDVFAHVSDLSALEMAIYGLNP